MKRMPHDEKICFKRMLIFDKKVHSKCLCEKNVCLMNEISWQKGHSLHTMSTVDTCTV